MNNMFYFIFVVFLISCSGVKRNLWLNQFEVCCKIEKNLERDGNKIEFKDNIFEDDYIKLEAEFDILEGIKLNIINKCEENAYVYWSKAFYIDENGVEHKVVNLQSSFDYKTDNNFLLLPPLIDIKIILLPEDFIYKNKNIWYNKTMFDFSLHPQNYLFKKTLLKFDYICEDNNLKYLLSFEIIKRYSKD